MQDRSVTTEPVDLTSAFAAVDALWDPRIVAQLNDYDVRIARVAGDFVWHVHDDTDEFFLVLDGELTIELREDGAERSVTLPRQSVFVVPRGVEHRPSSPGGASILLVEPTGTRNVGDHEGPLPDEVVPSVGRPLT